MKIKYFDLRTIETGISYIAHKIPFSNLIPQLM